MNEKIIVQLAEIILAMTTISGIAIIFAATWHDMRAIGQKKRSQTFASNLSRSDQPPVTVLLYSHNSAQTIRACLDSIVANTYDNYRIVIADNASTDPSKQIIADYKKTRPEITISVYTQKTHTDRMSALRLACKKARKNDLIFVMDASDRLSGTALRMIAAHFIARPRLDALRIHRRYIKDVTIGSLPAHFVALTKNILYKALSGHAITTKTMGHSGTILRSSALSPDLPGTKLSSTYDSMTTFVSPNPNTPQKTLARQSVVTVGLIAMLLAGITLISYFFYTAATLRSNTMLTLSWAIVSLWLLAVVWSDEVLALPKKIALTFTLPFAYFILYIQLFISVVSLTRKLISAISWPKIHVRNIHAALLQEAYSTRF